MPGVIVLPVTLYSRACSRFKRPRPDDLVCHRASQQRPYNARPAKRFNIIIHMADT